jgi:hypothetical protein
MYNLVTWTVAMVCSGSSICLAQAAVTAKPGQKLQNSSVKMSLTDMWYANLLLVQVVGYTCVQSTRTQIYLNSRYLVCDYWCNVSFSRGDLPNG